MLSKLFMMHMHDVEGEMLQMSQLFSEMKRAAADVTTFSAQGMLFLFNLAGYTKGILPKGPYLPCVSCHKISKDLVLQISSWRSDRKNVFQIMSADWDEMFYNFIISTMPADGLAPLGARPSAGMVVSKLVSLYIDDQHWDR